MENTDKTPEKYILFGASFNPPHMGHFSAISQMLDTHNQIIIFPYPQKFAEGKIEELPPISQRIKMLQVFIQEFFPVKEIRDRIMVVNLAAEIQKQQKEELTEVLFKSLTGQSNETVSKKILHTYDYLKFVKNRMPEGATLSACLGFEAQNIKRKEEFFNEEKIKSEFPHFYLEEETTIKSQDLRDFFSSHKNIKSKKDEQYIKACVGNSLAEFIFENNLYGVKKKVNQIKTEPTISRPKLR